MMEPSLWPAERDTDPAGFVARSEMLRLWRAEVDLATRDGQTVPARAGGRVGRKRVRS